jgi:hypothetical protein
MKKLVTIAALFLLINSHKAFSQASKPRTIVTSDGEFDDMDSYIRLLLYSNELNIVGYGVQQF